MDAPEPGAETQGARGAWFRRCLAAAATVLALGSLGCLSPNEADTARVEVSGEGGSGAVRVVTSTQFTVPQREEPGQGGATNVRLVSADSSVVDVPFQSTEDISETNRFWVEVSPPPDSLSGDVPDRVRLRVRVGGEQRFDRTANVETDTLRFRFTGIDL